MAIMAKAGGEKGNFTPPPQGTWAGICVDIVDLGIVTVEYQGQKKQQHKIRIHWLIHAKKPDGTFHEANKRYTLSLHEKAGLRRDLESWRGKPFDDVELDGFDVEKLLHAPALLNVVEARKEGNVYGNVTSIMRLPTEMKGLLPSTAGYIRHKDRKQSVGESQQQQPFGAITDDDIPF